MAILKLKSLKFPFKAFLLAVLVPVNANCASLELIKMAFLYNFSRYVSWPDSVFETEQSPFTICLNTDKKLIALLESTLADKTINSRKYEVKKVSDNKLLSDCQIYFISAQRYKKNSKIPLNQSLNLLIVSDYDGFAGQGGMIEIKQQEQRLKLLVNLSVVKESDLRIHSNLLNLMTIVK